MRKPVFMKKVFFLLVAYIMVLTGISCRRSQPEETHTIYRLATFNAAMFRNMPGGLIHDLADTTNGQARNVAEIIQIIRPGILALLEFDYDAEGKALDLFHENYLGISQHGNPPVNYPYRYPVPSNTGIPTLFDLNNDSLVTGPEDAFGFGRFPGQYAFAILSIYPVDTGSVRSFQHFRWKDMPNANLPVEPLTGKQYYSPEEMEILRLSSKNHIDFPVMLPDGILHVLAAHPTPPAFDGPEDRNGRRNFDEIRFFADYITPGRKSAYIYDDMNHSGGLEQNDPFVIMGDLNADPVDGDSYDHAIRQLLNHPAIHHMAAQEHLVPSSRGSYENARRNPRETSDNLGNPWHDTSVWGLRIDYILPCSELSVLKSGVFWPETSDSLYYLIKDNASSDHFLVWMDVAMGEERGVE